MILVGAHRDWQKPANWNFVHELDGSPDRIFFDENPIRTRAIAFESRGHYDGLSYEHTQRDLAKLSNPTSVAPGFGGNLESFFTFAPLEHVTKVTPCRRSTTSSSTVVGILFEYSTGRQACVGQIRTDSLDRPFTVQSGEKMWLGVKETSKGRTNVVTCDVDVAPPPRDDVTFLEIRWEGKLEWWFTAKESRVNRVY